MVGTLASDGPDEKGGLLMMGMLGVDGMPPVAELVVAVVSGKSSLRGWGENGAGRFPIERGDAGRRLREL